MAQFKFAVSGQFLDLLTPTKGISDGLFVNSFKFDFRSPEWETCAEKWVHFYNSKYSETSYDYLLDNDEIVPERGVNLPSGIWEVYVHGSVITNNEVIKRYVTENQSIQIIQSGIINAEPLSTIEPSVAEQLSALVTSAYKARITTATGSVDSGYGTPGVDVSISGEDAYKVITFDFHNIQGKGIASIVFTETGENEGLITVTMDNGDEIVFDGLRDAIASITNYTDIADEYLENTEAYATGKRNGEDVESDDPAYHNNAKYYNEQAAISAEAASGSSASANTQALKSEGYAVGKQNDENVDSFSPYYHNNAKYYKDQAASHSSAASTSEGNSATHALEAEGYAVGKQNGTDVQSGAYYQNNAKYYAEQAASSSGSASQYASAASGSADSAQGQAGNAQTYASAAQTHATDAQTYAGNAQTYAGNAQTYADNAGTSAASSGNSALKSEGYAVGQQNGTDVTEGSPYYENNAKYYAEKAAESTQDTEAIAAEFENEIASLRYSISILKSFHTLSWSQIQDIVQNGEASHWYKIGDQINVNWVKNGTTYVLPFDVVSFADAIKEGSNDPVPGLWLQSHYVLDSTQFDASEAIYVAPSAMAAGTYYFTIGSAIGTVTAGTSYKFTTTIDLPAGAQIMIGRTNVWNDWVGSTYQPSLWRIHTFSSSSALSPTESNLSLTEGTDGTFLGVLEDSTTYQTSGMNQLWRADEGYSRWSQSCKRQYLNSSAAAGSWWTPQNVFDRAPSNAGNAPGFMAGLDSDFKSVLGKVKITSAHNHDVDTALGDTEVTYDTFFVGSLPQYYCTSFTPYADEGVYFPYWKETLGLDEPRPLNANPYEAQIKYKYNATSTAAIYNTRSIAPDNPSWIISYSAAGALGYIYATYAYGDAPCCVIC